MRKRKLILVIYGLTAMMFLASFLTKNVPDSNALQNIVFKLATFYNWYPQQKVFLHTDKQNYNFDERIWIKAYLLDATGHKPDSSDLNLYVELINPSGYIVQTKIVRMEGGFGYCDFALQDTIPDGYYKLRAYTNWMRNLENDFFFLKDIYITNPLFKTYATRDAVRTVKKSRRRNIRKESGYDVQFLPEGGHLLSNVSNRVAFKAINDLGVSVDIEGELKDKNKNTVLLFSSLHKGMGAFSFTPEKGNKYTAHLKAEGMKKISVGLPQLIDMGINLSVDHLADDIRVKIITNLGEGRYPANTTYFFLGHVRGNPVFAKEIDIRDPENLTFLIPKKNIPTGVVHLTLFNYTLSPVTERLVFVNNNDILNINFSSDKNSFSKRDKVTLIINAADNNGRPVSSDLSLSVAGDTESKNISGIVSTLLLSSDLKGNLEDPDYYFADYTPEKEKELDYLMMTHGWRRFKWSEVLVERKLPVRYNKETGLEISGRITRDLFSLPLRDIKVTLTILDEFNDQFQTRSGHKGEFTFRNLYYRDTVSVRIEAVRPSGRKNLVILLDEMEQQRLEDMHYITEQIITRPGPKGRWVIPEEPEDDDPFKELNTQTYRIHSEPRDVIIIDDHLRNYQNVLQIIQGRIPGVNVYGNKVIIRGVGTLHGSTDPLFLVDGIAVDPDYALSMSPMDIEKIEVLKGPDAAIYGLRGANGVIAIYTRRGKFMIRGQLDFRMLGYATPSEFYSPKYEPERTDPYEDDRHTLFWEPRLKTDFLGNAEVSFYTSDIPGNYIITLEGISKEGLPGTKRKTIMVR